MENKVPVKRYIDFAGCNYIKDMYGVIKRQLELPDYVGGNLDALWDALTGLLETPADITIRRGITNDELIDALDEIIEVFYDAENECEGITVNVVD